jgi:LuxR family maltose regulon positive regulatory protein
VTERLPVDPHLVLKATPPKAAKMALARARLGLSALQLADKSVVAISASSGFGKTALLVQWRREAIGSGAAVAWLTLDQWDVPARLVDGLKVAVQIGTGKPLPEGDFKAPVDYDVPFGGLSQWLTRVASFAGDLLLVLDDVHWLPAETSDALQYLVHHAPANLRIVLASRKALPFAVSDLLARGLIASLDGEDLRLQLAETTAALHARFGNRIDDDACARLHQLTEGWALGLQLAMSSIDKQPSIREAVATCLAPGGDTRRFFVESLMQRLDRRDSEFLVAVSFLDALHPALCQAVTGYADSQETLERLCDATPILTEGVGSSWLRIHALAGEFLREGFAALPDADKQRYYSAAATWLAENGFHEEAARHALESGQKELAADLAESSLYAIYMKGQVSRIAQWADRLSESQLANRPRLRIALGWALAKNTRNADAAAIVTPILNDPASALADRFESIQIVAMAAFYMDRLDESHALLAPWRERSPGYMPVQRQVSGIIDALFALHQGGPEQARYLLTQATGRDSAPSRYATGARDWLIAYSYLWQGQVMNAEASLRVALAEVEPVAGRRSPIAAMLGATLAATLWERDQPDEIDSLLVDRRDVIDQYALPDVIILSYIVAARVAVEKQDPGTGYELLERLFAIGKLRGMPRLCVVSLGEQMRLAALQGREQSCATTADRLQQIVAEGQARGWGMLQFWMDIHLGLAEAYRHVARQDWESVRTSLARIKPVAEQLRRNKDLLQIHLLDSLASRKLGLDADAMFREGLLIIDTLGLARLLRDTHPLLADWSRQVRNKERRPEPVPAPGQGASARTQAAAEVAPSVLLTPKERDVIRLLANNLSNKEIATALDLSVETVKWHLKNLFLKLNAGSRKHLVDRARMLGLLIES